MNRLESALADAARDLDALGARWAVVGGLAVSARAEPRLTRDVDIAVSVTDDSDAERLIADLGARGYVPVTLVEQTATSRLATVRLRRRGSPILVDLLFSSSGIEPELVADAERIAVTDTLALPVARRPHLIALKVLSRNDRDRPQDLDDLRALLAGASEVDIEQARAALALIESRGFHRGRALVDAFNALLPP